MTTLKGRLGELAKEAPTPSGPEPDLWDRGVRIHRRRRTGTALIVAAACLLIGYYEDLTERETAAQLGLSVAP